MSALLAFDTHTYVKRLVSAGMPEPQAEVIADEQRNLITNELATKRDLKELEAGLNPPYSSNSSGKVACA